GLPCRLGNGGGRVTNVLGPPGLGPGCGAVFERSTLTIRLLSGSPPRDGIQKRRHEPGRFATRTSTNPLKLSGTVATVWKLAFFDRRFWTWTCSAAPSAAGRTWPHTRSFPPAGVTYNGMR